MMAGRILFCCFILSLQVGNNRSIEEIGRYYWLPGEDLDITCYNLSPGPRRIFCQGENVLLNTTSNKAARGRSSIKYSERVCDKSYNLTVRVSNLTLSDSGLYRCGLTDSPSTFIKFKAFVAEDLLDGSKDHHLHKEAGSSLTVACSFNFSGKTKYFCRGECEEGENILVYTDGVRAQSSRYSIGHGKHKSSAVFYVTIKNLTTSDSGRYRCLSYLSSRKNSYVDFNVSVSDVFTPAAPQLPSSHYVPVVVGVTLAAMMVLIPAVLLVSCRRRSVRDSRRRGDDGIKMENVGYKNVSSQDSTYQNLSPATTDQNQIYSTPTQP
ncbi:polymeric immunoglobulin receptor-like isoform X2 [Xiphophorus maculatus]|uniref:polymeric immunoglobulin receptor-like isoform X2 n=1 Tax=Xiphophorus maculatus TaxID=8083 RepID=UPI000C6D8F32|nr:polymeric immunoglobulin receptor-like isoform X2 [Xiphophorus maculatus]